VTSRPARESSSGVTLLELVVVVAILATAAVFALPAIRVGSDNLQLRAGASRVASLLREARQRAVTQRRPARVRLEASHRAVALAWDGTDVPIRRVELPLRFRLDAVEGIEALTFSPRGLARDARWAVEGPGGRRLVVQVHGVTGRVTVGAPAP
jgi:general secretion pathway protein H